MNIVVRPAEYADAPQMVELLNPIIRAGTLTAMQREVTVREQRDFIHNFPSTGIFNVAIDLDTGRLVGMQDVLPVDDPHEPMQCIGAISTFVAFDVAGRGVGSALMDHTLRAAQLVGFLILRAVIRSDNARAMAFYRTHGFGECAARTTRSDSGNDCRQVVLERVVEAAQCG